jgi:hypothetical protein
MSRRAAQAIEDRKDRLPTLVKGTTHDIRVTEQGKEARVATGGMEPPGVAGPAVSDCAAPDEVVASVADGVDG